MTILRHLEAYNLVNVTLDEYGQESGTLTERAKYLGYTEIDNLIEDIEDIFLIDFKTKSIIPAYRYLNNPVAVIGDSISDIIKFRVYNNTKFTSGIDLTNSTILPEIVWQNNTNNLQGIFQVKVADDNTNEKIIEGNIITFNWIIDPRALYRSGDLEFNVRFVNYDSTSNIINYNLATQTTKLKIESSLNYFSTLGEGDYNITMSFANPYLNNINTYIIDGGNIDVNV